MTISLIITTYNRADALELVLLSVMRQRLLPLEVIVADDGSGPETSQLVAQYQSLFPVPLVHSWQEDKGFRAARSRNLAIARSKGEYIVVLDGDMVLHPCFLLDHLRVARPGYFVNGSRALLNAESTKRYLQHKQHHLHWWSPGVHSRENAVRLVWVHHLVRGPLTGPEGIRTANMAFWRSDLDRVGGFDESFEGWGREDSELAMRLINAGIRRLNLKFAAIGFHLYHNEESREHLAQNDALLRETIETGRTQARIGLQHHAKE